MFVCFAANSSCQSHIIEWITQIYQKRDGVVFPVPWCEGFCYHLENIFTRLKIVAKEKTRGTLTKEITNMTSIFTSRMGKTTHFQKLAYDWTTKQDCKWDESFLRVEVLVLLRCRENLIESSIWESIEHEIMPKGTDLGLKETFFRFVGENPSNVLLVLDGLDEADPQKLAVYFDLVQGKLLHGCQIVLTSRYEAQKDAATHSDTLLEIVGFTKGDAECLIRKHFQHAGQMTGKLIRVLWHQNDDGDHSGDDQHIQGNLKELTKSPFNVLPNVTQLYVEIVRCLLKQCEIKNHLPNCGKDLFSVYKEDLMTLGRMALESLCKGERHFEVVEGNFKESLFIKFGFLSVQAGGRKRTSCFRYSFFNKSFQEFFSGLYLAFSIIDGEIDKKSVLTDKRFFGQARQVFAFMNEIIALQSKETAVSLAVSRANLEDRISSGKQNLKLLLAFDLIKECQRFSENLYTKLADRFGRNLDLTEIELSMLFYETLPDRISVHSQALTVNTSLISLDLSGDKEATSSSQVLTVNTSLTTVHVVRVSLTTPLVVRVLNHFPRPSK